MELGQLNIPMPGRRCQEPVGTAHVKHDENDDHEDRRYGEHLSEDDYLFQFLVVVDIRGKSDRYRGGGHAYEEDKLGLIEPQLTWSL
jgi:hypothetical protein